MKFRFLFMMMLLSASFLSFTYYEHHSSRNEVLKSTTLEQYETLTYETDKPSFKPFYLASIGYQKLYKEGLIENPILTIADFSLSANQERLWVIDMANDKVLYHTLVAHGQNSGDEYATKFSNKVGSHQSSLGFFLTDNLYHGKHGLSMRLDGLEKNWNDKARERAIVFHAADYVSHEFARDNGRLGRSFGCPALPTDVNEAILNDINGKSCFFIYYPDQTYLKESEIIGSVDV